MLLASEKSYARAGAAMEVVVGLDGVAGVDAVGGGVDVGFAMVVDPVTLGRTDVAGAPVSDVDLASSPVPSVAAQATNAPASSATTIAPRERCRHTRA